MFLITTSRRTSARVRTFVRDLFSVYPGSERFNRGSMGLEELAARIRSSGVAAALVVNMSQGNPDRIQVIDSDGSERMQISIDGVRLRREVSPHSHLRIQAIHSISTPLDAPSDTNALALLVAELAGMELIPSAALTPLGGHFSNSVIIRFDPLPGGKTIWGHYHAQDLKEIGPRVRIGSIRRLS